jgi:hypothetical protein
LVSATALSACAMSIDVENFVRDMDAIINGDAEDDADERREDAPSDHRRDHGSHHTLAPSSPPSTAEAKDPLDSWETVTPSSAVISVQPPFPCSDRVCRVCRCCCCCCCWWRCVHRIAGPRSSCATAV